MRAASVLLVIILFLFSVQTVAAFSPGESMRAAFEIFSNNNIDIPGIYANYGNFIDALLIYLFFYFLLKREQITKHFGNQMPWVLALIFSISMFAAGTTNGMIRIVKIGPAALMIGLIALGSGIYTSLKGRGVRSSLALGISIIFVLLAVSFLAPNTLSWLMSFPFVSIGLLLLAVFAVFATFATNGGTDHGIGSVFSDRSAPTIPPLSSAASSPSSPSTSTAAPPPSASTTAPGSPSSSGSAASASNQATAAAAANVARDAQNADSQEQAVADEINRVRSQDEKENTAVSDVYAGFISLFNAFNALGTASTQHNQQAYDQAKKSAEDAYARITAGIANEQQELKESQPILKQYEQLVALCKSSESDYVVHIEELMRGFGIPANEIGTHVQDQAQALSAEKKKQAIQLFKSQASELLKRYAQLTSIISQKRAEHDALSQSIDTILSQLTVIQQELLTALSKREYASVPAIKQRYVAIHQEYGRLYALKEDLLTQHLALTPELKKFMRELLRIVFEIEKVVKAD